MYTVKSLVCKYFLNYTFKLVIAVLVNWHISKYILTDVFAIFFKIPVEICKFTVIARTDLDVYFSKINISLGVQLSNRTTPIRTIPTLIFPTGQHFHWEISHPDNFDAEQLPPQKIPSADNSHSTIFFFQIKSWLFFN